MFRINSIENFQGNSIGGLIPFFNLKSHLEKQECQPYEKRSVNCYKEILQKSKDSFKKKITTIYSDALVKDIIKDINVESSECYENLNDFPTNMVSKILNFSKDTEKLNSKVEDLISKGKMYKESDIRFIQLYTSIQESLLKYHKEKISIIKLPEYLDNYVEDKDDCGVFATLKSEKDIDEYGKKNIVKHFIQKILDILDSVDTDTNKGTIQMYDPIELERVLKSSIIESSEDGKSPEMQETSRRVMASLGVVTRTISKYYCSTHVNCCHKQNCEEITRRIKTTKEEKKNNYKSMVELYERKYKKCVEANKTMTKQSKICKKIDLK